MYVSMFTLMYVCVSLLIHMHIETAELNRVTQGVGLRNPGWRRNWTCPLPRSGSVNLFKFLLFFLFSFLSLRGFSLTAWVTTSFGFWSLLNCHLPISNAFSTYQFAIKILHFYPYPPFPLFPLLSTVSLAARASSSPPRQTTAGAMEQQSSKEQPPVDVEDVSEVSVLPTQITSIDGFFNRKRGRPPKNRFVEVYKSVSRAKKFKFSSQIFRLLNR